jgi:hypothetical protein
VRRSRIVASVVAVVAIAGFAAFAIKHHDDDDDDDDDEDAEDAQLNYWRPHVIVIGNGVVASVVAPITCTSSGGMCGPTLIAFDERRPPLLRAIATPGWRFDHWESSLRTGPMPRGKLYINGFGYTDTGQTETVTAVFVPAR